MTLQRPKCAVQRHCDMSQLQRSLGIGEDSEHMAGWTVEHAGGVDVVLEFMDCELKRNTGVDIPQIIKCRLQPTYLKSIRSSINSSSSSCPSPRTMRERRSSTESGSRLNEPRDMPSPNPKVISRRYRTHSADADDLVGLRLSLAGFQPAGILSRQASKPSSSNDDALLDELHSDPYSSVIEKLRLQLRDCLPAMDEEMISKAVINAFSTDPSRIKAEPCIDKFQIEVELLCEAQQWAHKHLDATDECAQQEFLQQCLDKVFLQICRENLSSSSRALRIILNICSILGLQINDSVDVPNDTLLLLGLPRTATRKALYDALSTFGPINAIAISTEIPGFAYCRFADEASAQRVVEDRNAVAFGGSLIRASMLGKGTLFGQPIIPGSPPRRKCGATEEIEISPVRVSKQATRSSFVSSPHQLKTSSTLTDRQDVVFATDNYPPLHFL